MMSSLHSILVPAVSIYSLLLLAMFWIAVSRLNKREAFSWSKLFTALGTFSFLVSDGILAFDRFKFTIDCSQALIMTTYYAAQLGIAVSVVDPREVKKAKTV